MEGDQRNRVNLQDGKISSAALSRNKLLISGKPYFIAQQSVHIGRQSISFTLDVFLTPDLLPQDPFFYFQFPNLQAQILDIKFDEWFTKLPI